MCLNNCNYYDDLPLKMISSQHSNASARKIINENFELIEDILGCLKCIDISEINGIQFPNPLLPNVEYNWLYTGSVWTLVPDSMGGTSAGTKYIIQPTDYIYVAHGYQYIIHQHLYLDGILDNEGELVIL